MWICQKGLKLLYLSLQLLYYNNKMLAGKELISVFSNKFVVLFNVYLMYHIFTSYWPNYNISEYTIYIKYSVH